MPEDRPPRLGFGDETPRLDKLLDRTAPAGEPPSGPASQDEEALDPEAVSASESAPLAEAPPEPSEPAVPISAAASAPADAAPAPSDVSPEAAGAGVPAEPVAEAAAEPGPPEAEDALAAAPADDAPYVPPARITTDPDEPEELREPFGGQPPDLTLPHEDADALAEAKAITKQGARDLGLILAKHVKRHIPERTPAPPTAAPEPPKLKGKLGRYLPFMRIIPWALGALFALSFAWDFPGATVTLFGNEITVEGLLKTLAVSGLIGFMTNWLAITMLFQPREKRPIIPQGLIPAQRERVIFRLAQAISQELINEEIIKAKIQESGVITRYRETAIDVVHGVIEDEAFRADLKTFAEHYARDLLGSEDTRKRIAAVAVQKLEEQAGQGLGGIALKLYRNFREDDFQHRIDQAVAEIPNALGPVLDRIDALLDTVPERLAARADDLEDLATRTVLGFVERLDVYTMIVDNAEQYDEQQLERILKTTSNEQLNYIKYLGGILGVFGGFVIWQPLLALAVFTTAGLALWGLDEALYRAGRDA